MVGLGGLEPPTSPLSGARSSHLSYRPVPTLEETAHNSFSLRWLSFVCNCVRFRSSGGQDSWAEIGNPETDGLPVVGSISEWRIIRRRRSTTFGARRFPHPGQPAQ